MIRSFLVLVVFIALPLLAQELPTDELWEPDSNDPRAAEKLKERFAETREAYIDAFTEIRERLRSSTAWKGSDAAAAIQSKLDAQLTTVLRQLSEVRSPDDFLVLGYTTSRFQRDTAPDPDRWFEIHNERPENIVTLSELERIPVAAAEDFRYRVDAAHALLREFGAPAVAKTQKDIADINARWELFLNKGPSQYPWESFLNGLLIETGFERPPTRQYILFHPLAVVEVTNTSLQHLQASQALAVEMLGFAHYRFGSSNDTPTLRWFGASATVGIHENRDPSWGVMGHYNRTVTAGVLWGNDVERDDPTIIVGVDLYQLVQKKLPEYRERLKRINAMKD